MRAADIDARGESPRLTLCQEMEWIGEWVGETIYHTLIHTCWPCQIMAARLVLFLLFWGSSGILAATFCERDTQDCRKKIISWFILSALFLVLVYGLFESLRRRRTEYRERMSRELENSADHQVTAESV